MEMGCRIPVPMTVLVVGDEEEEEGEEGPAFTVMSGDLKKL